MEYEKDFVNEELVTLNIEGRVFKYKPTTGADENSWIDEVLVYDEKTKTRKLDLATYNKKKLLNIKTVPYTKELIEKVTGIAKEWADLTGEERYKLLGQLSPVFFDKLIRAIKDVDEPDEQTIKN